MHESLQSFLLILAISMIVAILARQIRLPYTIGLVIVGVVISLSGKTFHPLLSHDLIYYFLLPPLLFEASLFVPYHELKKDILPISLLAIVGTTVAAIFIAFSAVTFFKWPFYPSIIFGSLIAATDPVAIIAMFKDNKIVGRTSLLVEAESLLNDGMASILFSLAIMITQNNDILTISDIVYQLIIIVIGGILVGAVTGFLTILVTRIVDDHLVETVITLIAAYGAFFIAEKIHASGILSTVIAGLVIGNYGILGKKTNALSPKGRASIISFWEISAFLANSIIFLLLGINVAAISFQGYSFSLIFSAIIICMIGRGLAVYPIGFLMLKAKSRIALSEQNILWWGGLRGALGIALALSLPETIQMRDEIVVITFCVAVFSIVFQGITMPLILKRYGLMK